MICTCELTKKLMASALVAALAAFTAEARSLLYYYDFDKVENGALVYTGVNKGTGRVEPVFKQSDSPTLGYTTGALGSDHAFYTSNKSSIWLGDDSTSLGCGTEHGFTISFWCKLSSSHGAWTDFFGFRVGGKCYRFEYTAQNTTSFTIYGSPNALRDLETDAKYTHSGEPANVWQHFAVVATPNGTNSLGTCALYINGEKIANAVFEAAGDLQQLNVGVWVRAGNGSNRASSATNTGIDELAVFDYPATVEQVKWLAKFRPGQPVAGPGRAMPVAWNFDTTNTTVGVAAGNNGSGTDEAFLWGGNNPKATASPGGALDSAYCMESNNKATWRVANLGGLGATIASGYTISFWLKAKAKPGNWHDFFYYSLGDQDWALRFEWYSDNPAHAHAYGKNLTSTSAFTRGAETIDTWQHICLVWNPLSMTTDIYFGGSRTAQVSFSTLPSLSEPLTTIMLGSQSYDNAKAWRNTGGDTGVFVDELAFFNHSLSTNQIAWLGTHIPCLPPLDATNLVRTVSESGAWAGGFASWGVKEWDDANEAWVNTTRTTIYPALEDTEVEVAVALADGIVITNDTFVTPKKLVLAPDGTPVAPVSATLKCTADSRFAPQALEIGEGLQLTVPFYAVNVGGALTLGTGTKITFDVSTYDGGDTALVTDGIVLPAGESDVLAHFAVTDDRFTLSLSADGKTVYARLDNLAATAVWVGAANGALDSAANWECRNSAGALLPDVLPCDYTRVIVSGSMPLNVPEGTTIPWQYLRFEADDVSLSQDCDWRGLGDVVVVPSGRTVDLNGHKLYINDFDGEGTFTSGMADGELHIDVPDGATYENGPATLAGSLKLVKEGLGTLLITRAWHTYTGGTVIDGGVLKGAVKDDVARADRGAIGDNGSTITVNENGTIDVNGYVVYTAYTLVLNGGTMKNGAAVSLSNWTQWGDIRLADDSTFDLIYGYGLYGSNSGATTLDLGGHTLTVNLAAGQNFLLYHTTVKNGTVDVTSGGYLVADRTEVVATNADFRINCALNVKVPFSVRNYEAVYGDAGYNLGASVIEVNGTFKPSAHDCFHGCKMMDGSTIDFSSRTNALPLVSAFTSNGAKTLVFNADATVYVKFGNYRVANREPIIEWTAMPEDIDGVKFASVPGEKKRIFAKKEDGLYAITQGFFVIMR